MKVLVIGGGLAGLSAATLLTRFGIEVVTMTPEFGGLMSNVATGNPFGEGVFQFDFRLNAYPKEHAFHQLIRGVEGLTEHKRQAYYLEMPHTEHGHWIDYPVQSHSDQLLKSGSVVPSVSELPEYESDTSLKEVAVDLFGSRFYEDWFEPFNERMFSTDLAQLDSDWLTTKVAMSGHEAGSNWGMDNEFVYVPGNKITKTMIASLAEYAEDSWIWANAQAESLFQTKQGWNVVGRSGSSQLTLGPFDAVISTMGIAELVGSLERMQGVSQPYTQSNRIISCGVMLPGRYEGKPFTWFYPDVSLRAHRVSLQSRLSPEMSPGEQDSLLIEFPTFDELNQNVMESLSLDVETLMKLLGIDTYSSVWFSNKGYPIPTLGIRGQVAETKRQLARHKLYSTGRWGSHALLNNEHILGEVLRCVNYLMTDEEEHEYLWSTDFYQVYEENKYAY